MTPEEKELHEFFASILSEKAKEKFDRLMKLSEDARNDMEKSFQLLEFYGVPRERAHSVYNGIEVLISRIHKAVNACNSQK